MARPVVKCEITKVTPIRIVLSVLLAHRFEACIQFSRANTGVLRITRAALYQYLGSHTAADF